MRKVKLGLSMPFGYKVRMAQKLVDRLWVWQKNLRTLSSLVPSRKLPLLTPPVAFGPDIERFRDAKQSLVSWWDKQAQSWSFRGTLHTSRGRLLCFQLVFNDRHTQNDFLGAVPARWITPRVFSARFVLSDPMNGEAERTFRYWQRGGLLSRAPGFAADDRFHVEVGGWYAFRSDEGAIDLYANGDGDSIHLELTEDKPLAYHGQSGFAHRDPNLPEGAGGAAFHCGYPRMKTKGRVLLDGKLESVEGTTWLDHEKLTVAPERRGASRDDRTPQLRSDRIYLPLNTGHDLLIVVAQDRSLSGSWIDPEGNVRHLVSSDLELENQEFWISPETGARYPVKRRLRIETLDVELDIRANLPHQEVDTVRSTFSSQWQGAIQASGRVGSAQATAQGFMELSGYDPRPQAKVLEFLTGT